MLLRSRGARDRRTPADDPGKDVKEMPPLYMGASLRRMEDCGLSRGLVSPHRKPRTDVLGYSQPSLTGLFLAVVSTQDWRPGLLSAVPSGLDLVPIVDPVLRVQGVRAYRDQSRRDG
jgi:hypothetical protein